MNLSSTGQAKHIMWVAFHIPNGQANGKCSDWLDALGCQSHLGLPILPNHIATVTSPDTLFPSGHRQFCIRHTFQLSVRTFLEWPATFLQCNSIAICWTALNEVSARPTFLQKGCVYGNVGTYIPPKNFELVGWVHL